jgi:hypothetical protein
MNTSIRSDNTSGFVGVRWHGRDEMWQASIKVGGKQKYLGSYDNIDFAIGARQQAEREIFGEFAYKGEKGRS